MVPARQKKEKHILSSKVFKSGRRVGALFKVVKSNSGFLNGIDNINFFSIYFLLHLNELLLPLAKMRHKSEIYLAFCLKI